MSSPVASSSTRPTFFGLFDRPATPEHAIDAFFGASRPSTSRRTLSLTGTRDSRHDDAGRSTIADSEVPPSYEDSLEPPSYTQVSDQPTLAMYLFKFGFLFPLFWLAGAFILLSPLRAPEDWETTKPEYERQELIESMRRTELKWAKRCLYALIITILLVAIIVLGVVFATRS
ncbi:hypothetical protein C8Q76DRAFT_860148 [Earliella scabrosa]|nr:hypothetical protein C8Q76DRAFT_860148 [Earliella scabrosa]